MARPERVSAPEPVYPNEYRGQTWCVSNRNVTLRTTKGHTIFYQANKPVLTPNSVLEDAMAIGIMPKGKVQLPDEDDASVLPAELEGSARIAQIREVCDAMIKRNGRYDFTASGQPNIKVVNKALGFDIDVTELNKVWAMMQEEKAAERVDPISRIEEVLPERPSDPSEVQQAIDEAIETVMASGSEEHFTADGKPTVRAIENVLDYDISEDERDAGWARHNHKDEPASAEESNSEEGGIVEVKGDEEAEEPAPDAKPKADSKKKAASKGK